MIGRGRRERERSLVVRKSIRQGRKNETTLTRRFFSLFLILTTSTTPTKHKKQQAAECPARDVDPRVLHSVAALAGLAGPAATAELVCDAVCALERALISSSSSSSSSASSDASAAAAEAASELPCSSAGAAVFVAAAMRGCPEAATPAARRLLSRGWGSHQGRARLAPGRARDQPNRA